jgi:uncharacterized protein (TIGR01777 family)
MTVGITGGTGFIGHHLCTLLKEQGHDVVIFTRSPMKQHDVPHVHYAYWDPYQDKFDLIHLQKVDAMIHLAGAGIADKRWTEKRKEEIVHSRVHTTNFLVAKLKEYGENCKALLSASAIGYYGPDRPGHSFFKESDSHYNDFLGETCEKWEEQAHKAEGFLRTVIFRFGIVMGREDGMFAELSRAASVGVLPILGGGKQMISWIHADDLCRMMIQAIQNEDIKGVYNAVSPHPVSQRQLMRTIAKVKGGLKIPLPVPKFILKTMLGEMSSEVLKSTTVSAEKTLKAGFELEYDTIEKAVREILNKDQ